jgi:hypothetical protein
MDLRALEKKRDHCLQEITRRTPPRNDHEVVMLEAYRCLLDDIDFRLFLLAEISAND